MRFPVLTRLSGMFFLAGAALAACHSAPPGAGVIRPSNDFVLALVSRYDSGWVHHDTSTVGSLLAPAYQYITNRGTEVDRGQIMAILASPDFSMTHGRRSEISIDLYADVATVVSRWQTEGSYQGEPYRDDQRCTQLWVRRDVGWQLTLEQCTNLQ